jgi:hypothetical protein
LPDRAEVTYARPAPPRAQPTHASAAPPASAARARATLAKKLAAAVDAEAESARGSVATRRKRVD